MPEQLKRKRLGEFRDEADVQFISSAPRSIAAKMDLAYEKLLRKSPSRIRSIKNESSSRVKAAAERAQAAGLFDVTTDEAVEEYWRLIALKVFTGDFDDTKLGSTLIMDAVWLEIIVDTKAYEALLGKLGCKLHRNPDGGSEGRNSEWEAKMTMMEALYTKFFGGLPLGTQQVSSGSVQVRQASPLPHSAPRQLNFGERIHIYLTNGDEGKLSRCTISSTCPIHAEISKTVREEMKIYNFRVFFRDEILTEGHTANDCGIITLDTLLIERNIPPGPASGKIVVNLKDLYGNIRACLISSKNCFCAEISKTVHGMTTLTDFDEFRPVWRGSVLREGRSADDYEIPEDSLIYIIGKRSAK